MADIELVIDIPKEYYKAITEIPNHQCTVDMLIIKNGTPLPKGHGDLVDRNDLKYDKYNSYAYAIANAPTIIEADKEYEAKAITRGNCMMCGKELTEGLFFCKECEDKANSEKENKE